MGKTMRDFLSFLVDMESHERIDRLKRKAVSILQAISQASTFMEHYISKRFIGALNRPCNKSYPYLSMDVEQFFNSQFQKSTLINLKNTFATLKADLLGDMTLQILIDVYDSRKSQKEWEIHTNRKHLLSLSTVTSGLVYRRHSQKGAQRWT